MEAVLTKICNAPITLHGAGRTDAGVHALAMVANFTTSSTLGSAKIKTALNAMLPFSIRITAIEEVPLDFHSRYSAVGKTYLYNIETSPLQSPFTRLYAVHILQQLAFEQIHQCLEIVTGTHDFASFETSGSRDKSIQTGRGSTRTLHSCTLKKTGETAYQFRLCGDGFLRHMVRNIIGGVLMVGKGQTSVQDFREILLAKDRSRGGATAPAHGLFLEQVHYATLPDLT